MGQSVGYRVTLEVWVINWRIVFMVKGRLCDDIETKAAKGVHQSPFRVINMRSFFWRNASRRSLALTNLRNAA